MTHLGTLNISYGQKLRITLISLCVGDVPHTVEKISTKATIFFKPHFNQRSTHKVMGLQSCENPNLRNFKTPNWESHDKMTFGCWSCDQAHKKL